MTSASPCLAHGCDACCWETEMLLSEDDAERLAARGHARADFSETDADGFLRLQNVEAADGSGRRHCFFLRGGRCSVYADRPQGCRFYPLTLSSDALRLVRDADCPHRGEFPAEPSAGRRLRALLAVIAKESRRRG